MFFKFNQYLRVALALLGWQYMKIYYPSLFVWCNRNKNLDVDKNISKLDFTFLLHSLHDWPQALNVLAHIPAFNVYNSVSIKYRSLLVQNVDEEENVKYIFLNVNLYKKCVPEKKCENTFHSHFMVVGFMR